MFILLTILWTIGTGADIFYSDQPVAESITKINRISINVSAPKMAQTKASTDGERHLRSPDPAAGTASASGGELLSPMRLLVSEGLHSEMLLLESGCCCRHRDSRGNS